MGTENSQKKKKKDSIFDLPVHYFDSASVLRLPYDTANSASDPHKVSLNLALGVSSLDAPIPNENENGNGENEEEKQGMGMGMGMGMSMTRWSCKTCTAEFSSLEEQRFHFKSDFHRFNIWKLTPCKTKQDSVDEEAHYLLYSVQAKRKDF